MDLCSQICYSGCVAGCCLSAYLTWTLYINSSTKFCHTFHESWHYLPLPFDTFFQWPCHKVIVIKVIIIVAFKGAIRDILLSPHCPTNRLQHRHSHVQITCNTSSTNHVQHVMFCATWYEGTAQQLRVTEFKSHLFELYFIG